MATREELLFALRRVLDPELGVNIVDLGLVQQVSCDAQGDAAVEMTLTSPACPLGDYFYEEVPRALERVPGVRSTELEIVLEPVWSPERMSDEARRQLGWSE
jgi:metal-sulfur cluster biosynthetic enzyme